MVEIMPELATKGEGQPLESALDPRPGHELLSALQWSDWPEADLSGVLRYVRGNKHLNMPLHWKNALPTHIPRAL